jgi:hypothetical protein
MVRRRSPVRVRERAYIPANRPFLTNGESLSIKEGLAGRLDQSFEDSLQIRLLATRAEHLREREGLDEAPALSGFKLAGNNGIWRRASTARRPWGQVLGSTERPSVPRAASNSDRAGLLRRPFIYAGPLFTPALYVDARARELSALRDREPTREQHVALDCTPAVSAGCSS